MGTVVKATAHSRYSDGNERESRAITHGFGDIRPGFNVLLNFELTEKEAI